MTTGDRGAPGKKGESGDQGVAGERGQKGEHGSIGPTGLSGRIGPKGEPGAESLYLGKKQTLILFTFIVFAFVLLAARSEINANNNRQGVYENCLTRAQAESVSPDCESLR